MTKRAGLGVKSFSSILIAGPTASGKSALALALARKLGGVVINADSMQVYRDIRILTACPGQKERGNVPHRLFAFRSASQPFSVAAWLALAEKEAMAVWNKNRVAIFTGGTGLYFKALLKGLAPVPEIPAEVRENLRTRLATGGVAPLYDELKKRDPAIAKRLKPNDRQRILRALEVVAATGTSLLDWQRTPGRGLLSGKPVLKICLTLPRSVLEQRSRARLERMVAEGALKEVAALARQNLSPELPALKALGVRPLLRHLDGGLSLDGAVGQTVIESRQYAKRQMTWFRNQFADWKFLSAEPDPAPLVLRMAEKAFRARRKRPIRRARAAS